jgi:hypothetical protein
MQARKQVNHDNIPMTGNHPDCQAKIAACIACYLAERLPMPRISTISGLD